MYIPAADAYMETPMTSTNPMTATGTPMTSACLAIADHPDGEHERGHRGTGPRNSTPNRSPPRAIVPKRALRIEEDRLTASIGPDVLEGQDRDHEEGGHGPGQAAGEADEAADEPEPVARATRIAVPTTAERMAQLKITSRRPQA